MGIYEETHINLLVRLTREAHAPSVTTKRFVALANAIADFLIQIEGIMVVALFIWLR